MEGLRSLLAETDIVTPDSDPGSYRDLTTFWGAQNNLKPRAVIVPSDVQTLAKVVHYVYNCTDLGFAFRGQGYLSLPRKDILISLHKIDGFSYDDQKHTIMVGAGQHWTPVYEAIERHAPDYTVVGARTPSVGVGGTIITGGFSWLSGDRGCISDPRNLLDCEVVKHDGSIVWASSDPDLLWALRGGGGGIGVITKAVFQLWPLNRNIHYGTILVPKSALHEAMNSLAAFSATDVTDGVSVFMFLERPKFQDMHQESDGSDMIVFQIFDSNGDVHSRSVFSWILNLPGAIDLTQSGSILDAVRVQERVSSMRGKSIHFFSSTFVPSFSETQLENCVRWFTDLESHSKSIAENTFMVFELFCTRDFGNSSAMAWPGPRGKRHMLVMTVGCGLDAQNEIIETAKRLAEEAPRHVMGEDSDITPAPNAIEAWSDLAQIYGPNYQRLMSVRKRYDPKGRFQGHIGEKPIHA